ncbi:MAG TPA: hypothetical protein DCZ55_00720 [Cyanobacteria bacterium UBA11371]|nr:hypothetical protein [Cyanobacteria bacterium UBA11371]HBE30173.1 hypothetical protein [Cyanobacteria bacterium UBA11368]
MQSASILHQEAEPLYTRSQVEPGNEILEALPPVVLQLEAEPLYTRSQVEPGNEILEALPPVVEDVKLISRRCLGFFPFYFLVLAFTSGCDSVVSGAKDILVTPATPIASVPAPKNTNKKPNTSRYAALEAEIHAKINQYRQSQNLPPLTLDPRISEQARIHSQAMASRKATFSHDGFEKRVDAIAKSIPYRSAGENLAYNQGYRKPVDQAVEGWLNSPGHYKNIVGDFDLTGVGVVKTPQGRYYFTQIFIRRAKYGIF